MSYEELIELFNHITPETRELALSFIQLCDDAILALAEKLQCLPHLEKICLNQCNITDMGATILAKALPHLNHLKTIELSDNAIEEAGAIAIAAVLPRLPKLKSICLSNNLINELGTQALVAAVQALPELEEFELKGNKIGLDGAYIFLHVLTSQATIQQLFLDCIDVREDVYDRIQEQLEINRQIRLLEKQFESICTVESDFRMRACKLYELRNEIITHFPTLDSEDLEPRKILPFFENIDREIVAVVHSLIFKPIDAFPLSEEEKNDRRVALMLLQSNINAADSVHLINLCIAQINDKELLLPEIGLPVFSFRQLWSAAQNVEELLQPSALKTLISVLLMQTTYASAIAAYLLAMPEICEKLQEHSLKTVDPVELIDGYLPGQSVYEPLGYFITEENAFAALESLLGGQQALVQAAGIGHLDAVRAFLVGESHNHTLNDALCSAIYYTPSELEELTDSELKQFSINIEIINTLLKAGANPNSIYQDDINVLMWAAQNGQVEIVNTLLAAGADSMITNAEHQTALDIAHFTTKPCLREHARKALKRNGSRLFDGSNSQEHASENHSRKLGF